MLPLIILLATFGVMRLSGWLKRRQDINAAARIAFGIMFLFTGTSHFYLNKGMSMGLPPFIPHRELIVDLTGLIEIVLALMLMRGYRTEAVSKAIIILLLLIAPANIYAAAKHLDMQTATYDGPGLSYLFFRIPLQLFFIGWVWLFGVRGFGHIRKTRTGWSASQVVHH